MSLLTFFPFSRGFIFFANKSRENNEDNDYIIESKTIILSIIAVFLTVKVCCFFSLIKAVDMIRFILVLSVIAAVQSETSELLNFHNI